MMCRCGGETRVVDSRTPDPRYVKRRRVCEGCGESFATYESRDKPWQLQPAAKNNAERMKARRQADPELWKARGRAQRLKRKAKEAAQITGQPVEIIYQQWGIA